MEKIFIKSDSGIEKELNILFSFLDEESQKEYVFLFEDDKEDEIIPFELIDNTLMVVEDEDTLEYLSDVLESYENENE